MTVCTDVYVRPQTCEEIWVYPSQVHPFIPPTDSGGGGVHPKPWVYRPDRERKPQFDTDEEILAALGLL